MGCEHVLFFIVPKVDERRHLLLACAEVSLDVTEGMKAKHVQDVVQ